MKLINLSLIIVLVLACLLGIHNFKISEIENDRYVEAYYSRQLDRAAEDACNKLKKSVSVVENGLFTEAEIRPEEIFNEFFKSLSLSLNLDSNEDRLYLESHFPILALIEEDGIVLSSIRDYEEDGYQYRSRIIMPKIPFYFIDEDIVYFPKLSGEVEVVYREDGVWKKEYGKPSFLTELAYRTKELNFLKQPDIDKKLRLIIAGQISDVISLELERLIKQGEEARENYDFYLPSETDEIAKQIDEASLIAFMQGYRPSGKKKIDLVCRQRLDIKKSDFFVGFVLNGIKYYTRDGDKAAESQEIVEAFSNEIDAVKAGYHRYRRELD